MRLLMLLSCLLATAYCQDDLYFRQPEKIVNAQNEVGDRLGNYAFTYETEGGILQRESGKRKYEGTDDETQLIQGSVQYNAPDGTPVAISWTADEYGARVSGTHLPTPPPIPPEIQRALDWLAKQPTTPEPDYDSAPSLQRTTFKPAPAPAPAPAAPANKPILLKSQQFNKPLPALNRQRFF